MAEVEYARAPDGTHLAFRVLDEHAAPAANDLVMVSGGLVPMELFDELPGFARLLEGLAALGRLVVFDRRGIGLSDPISDWTRPVPDQWADDLAAVVAASTSRPPVVIAWDGYGVGSRYAAAHPESLSGLVLYQPLVAPPGEWEAYIADRLAAVRANLVGEGTDLLAQLAPSCADDPGFRAWYTRAGRSGASPATAARIWDSIAACGLDQHHLDAVTVPTLVLARSGNEYAAPGGARFAAASLPRGELVEVDGRDHFPFCGDVDALVAEIAAFAVGERRVPPPRRLLAALLFTDLVASTEQAAALGDERWKSVLDRHDAVVRAAVGRSGGEVVKTTGDGVLALVPWAGGAVNAAVRIRDALAHEGLAVRIGIHVGDVDRRGDDVSGLAVHVAARVMAAAGAGEIVVTRAARDADTEHAPRCAPMGTRPLKGVPGEWELFRVSDG